jgi:hypothetical protein
VSVSLYMDVHVHNAITLGLRRCGVTVFTAQEDGARRFVDPVLLDRATALGCVLFSQDADLLSEAARRQQSGEFFAGVIYAHQTRVSIRQCIEDLTLLAQVAEPEDFVNRVEYLPLK